MRRIPDSGAKRDRDGLQPLKLASVWLDPVVLHLAAPAGTYAGIIRHERRDKKQDQKKNSLLSHNCHVRMMQRGFAEWPLLFDRQTAPRVPVD